MPTLAAALPYIAVAATLASTGVAVYSTNEAASQAKKAQDFKAKELERQALEAQQTAGIQVAAQNQRALTVLSSIRANAAASGVDPGAGSAFVTFETSGEQAQLNDMYTKYAGNIQAQGDLSQAALATYGGNVAKSTGFYTSLGDAFGGIGTAGQTIAKYPKSFGIS